MSPRAKEPATPASPSLPLPDSITVTDAAIMIQRRAGERFWASFGSMGDIMRGDKASDMRQAIAQVERAVVDMRKHVDDFEFFERVVNQSSGMTT